MAFSFLTQEIAMDLGTANTVIFRNDDIVMDAPSIVAIDNNTGKCIAIGQQAKLMHEHTNPGIKTIRPLRNGVIADFNAAEMMIKGFIKQVNNKKKIPFHPEPQDCGRHSFRKHPGGDQGRARLLRACRRT